MEILGLSVLSAFFLIIIVILWLKIVLMRKSAREISTAFADRLTTETNVLIDISSHDRYMRSLAADINTQLRTPLTAVCGYLDLLRQTDDPADAMRYIRIMEERIDALKQLTEELFGYSTAFSKVSESREEISLNAALEESVSAYYAALKKRRITPDITMPETKVIRWLNKNALKYSDGDLKITLSKSGEITFANHAAALDELQVMKLFERYYTVENAANATGLGLSIAKELTVQMGGTIAASYEDQILRIVIHF